MKPKDSRAKLVIVAVASAIVSLILSSVLISSPKHHTQTAPVVDPITPTLPDIHNDPTYNTFLNSNSLDATQTVRVGTSQNNQPFTQ